MKSFATLLIGVALITLSTGCCCLWPHGGGCSPCGYSAYGSGYGGCPGGACGTGVAPGGGYPAVIPQGAYYNGFGAAQMASAPAPVFGNSMVAAAPTPFMQTAMVGPLDPLPTF